MADLGQILTLALSGGAGYLKGRERKLDRRYDREQDAAKVQRENQQREQDTERQRKLDALTELVARSQVGANDALANQRSIPDPPYNPETDPQLLREQALQRHRLGRYTPGQGPAPRNIDPLSDAGIDAAARRERAVQSARPSQAGGRMLPSGTVTQMAKLDALVPQIDEAIAAINANPAAIGPLDQFVPNWLAPKNTAARAQIMAIASRLLNDLSGAAISEQEYKRLAKLVPTEGDRHENAITKLTQLKRETERTRNTRAEGYAANGYRPYGGGPGAPATPAPAAASSAPAGDATAKAERFEALREQHPDWSAERIAAIVNREMP